MGHLLLVCLPRALMPLTRGTEEAAAGNVNVSQCSMCDGSAGAQYLLSAQCSAPDSDDPDGVGTSAADDPWLKAPTASQFHVYLPYRGLMPV